MFLDLRGQAEALFMAMNHEAKLDLAMVAFGMREVSCTVTPCETSIGFTVLVLTVRAKRVYRGITYKASLEHGLKVLTGFTYSDDFYRHIWRICNQLEEQIRIAKGKGKG